MTIVARVIFILAIFVLVVGVVMAICVLVYYLPAKCTCSTKDEMLGMEYKFDLIGGCFIRDENGWFEYNQQRVIR